MNNKVRTNLEKFGFAREGEDMVIYRVCGDTYSIKDELKAMGCKFNPSVGWYASHELDDHATVRLVANDILTFFGTSFSFRPKAEIAHLWRDSEPVEEVKPSESPSEWQGEIGQKINLSELWVARKYGFTGKFGYSYVYSFCDRADNVFVWFTATDHCEEGDIISLTGTVKDHTTYTDRKGCTTKQTQLTRCRVTVIESEAERTAKAQAAGMPF